MKVETAAEQLLFSTLRIQCESSIGTGAIVTHKWGDGKEGPFLVTNKHVVAGSQQGQITFSLGEGDGEERQPKLGERHTVTMSEAGWSWTGHPSDGVDIAVLPLGGLVSHVVRQGFDVFYKSIPTTFIPNEEELSEMDAVEEVLFIGYPNGIYDSANNLPIARKGITATPPEVDYDAKPCFLIDGSVFPGSSGSPVFLYRSGAWSTRDRQLRHGEQLRLLGILGSAYLREDDGAIRFEEIPAALRPIVKTPQMIDLGVVFSARCIVETIELLLRERGELPADSLNGADAA